MPSRKFREVKDRRDPAPRVKPLSPRGSAPPAPPYKQEKHHLDRRAESLLTIAAAADDDELLNSMAVANWLGTTQQWLSIGRGKANYGPPFIKVSKRRVMYRRGDIRVWLRERTEVRGAAR